MSLILLVARVLLALVFVVAGLAKLADRAGARQALQDFGVPAALATPLGLLLPLAELAVVLALLPTRSAWWGLWAPSCSCFSSLPGSELIWPAAVRRTATASASSTPRRSAGPRSPATRCWLPSPPLSCGKGQPRPVRVPWAGWAP